MLSDLKMSGGKFDNYVLEIKNLNQDGVPEFEQLCIDMEVSFL